MKKHITITAVTMTIMFASFSANAVLLANWNFTNSGQVFSPTDTVVMYGTIYNSVDSTEDFLLDSINSAGTGYSPPLSTEYTYSWGPVDTYSFFTQFDGVVLAPGESFDFTFGSFTPDPGAIIADGTYGISNASISSSRLALVMYTDPFSFTVSSAVASVPEPSTILMMAIGLLGIGLSARAKKI